MILYLVLILVGVYYATRLFARIAQRGVQVPRAGFMGAGKRGKKQAHAPRIFLIDRFMFDKERGILLIEEGDKRYLLGMSAQSIHLLKEMDAPPKEEAPQDDAQAPPASASFLDIFNTWKDKGKHEE